MENQATTDDLFDLAIAMEEVAEVLYLELAAKFAFDQDVACFWIDYAMEERAHANSLKQIKNSLSPEQLAAPADPQQLKDALKAMQFSTKKALEEIKTLEDAYQLVNEVESSETNSVFEFLIDNFAAEESVQSFLREQLRNHIAHLTHDLPLPYQQAANRKKLKAL